MREWILTLIMTHDWAWFPAMLLVVALPCVFARAVSDWLDARDAHARNRRCR